MTDAPAPAYTILVTASLIPSHPSLVVITTVLESLAHLKGQPAAKIVIAHDSPHKAEMTPEDYSAALSRFEQYLANLRAYVEASGLPDVVFTVTPTGQHWKVESVKHALAEVETEYFMVLEHDFAFCADVDMDGVLKDMSADPRLKHVRFNKRRNTMTSWCADRRVKHLWGKLIEGKHHTYTSTGVWSENPHMTTKSYYRDVVFPSCPPGTKFAENRIAFRARTEALHAVHGTYLFGQPDDPSRPEINMQTVVHIDGTDRKNKQLYRRRALGRAPK